MPGMNTHTHPRPRPRFRPGVERLESLDLASAATPFPLLLPPAAPATVAPVAPVVHVAGGTDANPGYTGAELRAAYGFPNVFTGPQAGQGITVGIVVVGDNPLIQWDLDQFSAANSLPSTPIYRLTPDGISDTPTSASIDPAWTLEAALDVEDEHLAAPAAKILLVEAASADEIDLYHAANVAAEHAQIVSMSFGSPEDDDIGAFDGTRTLYVASAGDQAGSLNTPASDPSVLAVGGTNVITSASGRWASEKAWADSPSGLSGIYSRRYVPDISGPGARDSAVQIWVGGTPDGYLPHANPVHAYGTSEAAPFIAGEFACIEAVSHIRFSASGVVTGQFFGGVIARGPSARTWLAQHRDAEHRFPRGGYGSLDMGRALADAAAEYAARHHPGPALPPAPTIDLPPLDGFLASSVPHNGARFFK